MSWRILVDTTGVQPGVTAETSCWDAVVRDAADLVRVLNEYAWQSPNKVVCLTDADWVALEAAVDSGETLMTREDYRDHVRTWRGDVEVDL